MKLYSIFTVVLYVFTLHAAGQISNLQKAKKQSAVQAAVNHIDSVVKAILTDTSIIYTTVETESKKGNSSFSIQAGYKNGRLQVLQTASSHSFLTGSSQAFYFENGEPVLYVQQIVNGSRMGSCGQVAVAFYHYLKDSAAFAGMAKSTTGMYSCYGYRLEKPAKHTLADRLALMQSSLNKRGKPHKPAKVGLPFIAAIPLTCYQWPVEESYGF